MSSCCLRSCLHSYFRSYFDSCFHFRFHSLCCFCSYFRFCFHFRSYFRSCCGWSICALLYSNSILLYSNFVSNSLTNSVWGQFGLLEEFRGLGFSRLLNLFSYWTNCLVSYWTNCLNYPRRIWKESIIKKSCGKFGKKKVGVWSLNTNLRQLKAFFLAKIMDQIPFGYWNLLTKSFIQIY